MKDTSFQQQAHLIWQEVMAAMGEERAAMVQEVKESNESILSALQTAPEPVTQPIPQNVPKEPTVVSDTSSITQSANKMEQDSIQLEMLKILQKIDKKLDNNNNNNKCGCDNEGKRT